MRTMIPIWKNYWILNDYALAMDQQSDIVAKKKKERKGMQS